MESRTHSHRHRYRDASLVEPRVNPPYELLPICVDMIGMISKPRPMDDLVRTNVYNCTELPRMSINEFGNTANICMVGYREIDERKITRPQQLQLFRYNI